MQEGGRVRGKREGESCWKSGGGRVRLYTWRRTGLADEVRSDAIPDAAKADRVIQRSISNRISLCTCACKGGRRRRPWRLFSARFPPHSILQDNFEVQYRTTSATLSRNVLRLILPIPLQQTRPEVSCKFRKILHSKREIVL